MVTPELCTCGRPARHYGRCTFRTAIGSRTCRPRCKTEWTQAADWALSEEYPGGVKNSELAQYLSLVLGTTITSCAIRSRVAVLGLHRKTRSLRWTEALKDRLRQEYQSGTSKPEIARRLSDLVGEPVTVTTVTRLVKTLKLRRCSRPVTIGKPKKNGTPTLLDAPRRTPTLTVVKPPPHAPPSPGTSGAFRMLATLAPDPLRDVRVQQSLRASRGKL